MLIDLCPSFSLLIKRFRIAKDFATGGEAQNLMRHCRPRLSQSTRIPFPGPFLWKTPVTGNFYLSKQPALALDSSGCNIQFGGGSLQGVSSPISQKLWEGRDFVPI